MCRQLFSLSKFLLCLLLICFGSTAVRSEGNGRKVVQLPKGVDLFLPHRTIVEAHAGSKTRDSFVSPSLAYFGGVLVALAEGHIDIRASYEEYPSAYYADVVAGYINSAKNWSSFVDEVNANEWRAHSIFNMTTQDEHDVRVRRKARPTTIARGNKVFLLAGGYSLKYEPSSERWIKPFWGLDLLVGEATQDKVIQWGKPTSLVPQIEPSAKQLDLDQFVGGGGSGVVMEDGTLVFPVTARRTEDNETASMIIYSKDDGKNWLLSQGMLPARCSDPLIIEWEQGQLVMVAKCDLLSNVFESRDMGATWREAVRTLTRVQPRFLPNSLRTAEGVGSFTTATIAGKKVMLYTQKGIPPGSTVANTLYLWVADNNRTFYLGPISMDTAVEEPSVNALLHSNNALHLLQVKGDYTESSLFFTSLPEQLKTITSVLETWAKMDSFLSNSSVPTTGLVGFLSDASGDGTWNDAYRCVNATVTNAKKVENGFKFTGSESYAMWPVNMRRYHNVQSLVNHEFTLVATVTIAEVPKENAPLLGAALGIRKNSRFVGLSYTTEKRWGTVFNGITRTIHNSTWKPGREYQVALMLQGNEGSVYVDGVLVGNTNKLPTLEERRYQISHFYFGGGENSSVTVKNVFLYNRRLSQDELKAVNSSHVSEQRAVDSSDSTEQRAVDNSDMSEQRAVDSSDMSEQRAVDSSDASEQRAVDSSGASKQRAVNSSDM
ncbi:group II trans-sialidase superfamily, partial [Trypanosoma rangeli]